MQDNCMNTSSTLIRDQISERLYDYKSAVKGLCDLKFDLIIANFIYIYFFTRIKMFIKNRLIHFTRNRFVWRKKAKWICFVKMQNRP